MGIFPKVGVNITTIWNHHLNNLLQVSQFGDPWPLESLPILKLLNASIILRAPSNISWHEPSNYISCELLIPEKTQCQQVSQGTYQHNQAATKIRRNPLALPQTVVDWPIKMYHLIPGGHGPASDGKTSDLYDKFPEATFFFFWGGKSCQSFATQIHFQWRCWTSTL